MIKMRPECLDIEELVHMEKCVYDHKDYGHTQTWTFKFADVDDFQLICEAAGFRPDYVECRLNS